MLWYTLVYTDTGHPFMCISSYRSLTRDVYWDTALAALTRSRHMFCVSWRALMSSKFNSNNKIRKDTKGARLVIVIAIHS
jgi:hypothetical protein